MAKGGFSFQPDLVGSVLVGTCLKVSLKARLQARFEVIPWRGNPHDFAWYRAGSVGYIATWK